MSLEECCWLTEQGDCAIFKGCFLLCCQCIHFCHLFNVSLFEFFLNKKKLTELSPLPTLVSECFSSEVQLMIYRCHRYKTITEAQPTISFGMSSVFACA